MIQLELRSGGERAAFESNVLIQLHMPYGRRLPQHAAVNAGELCEGRLLQSVAFLSFSFKAANGN